MADSKIEIQDQVVIATVEPHHFETRGCSVQSVWLVSMGNMIFVEILDTEMFVIVGSISCSIIVRSYCRAYNPGSETSCIKD